MQRYKNFALTFDHTYEFWKARAVRRTEKKLKKQYKDEIQEKEIEKADDISKVLMQMDVIKELSSNANKK